MNKALDMISEIFIKMIWIIAIVASGLIFAMSLLSWANLDIDEYLYQMKPNIIIMGVGSILLLTFMYFIWNVLDKIKFKPVTVFIVLLLLTTFWILISQNGPTDDASYCLKIADELADGIPHSFIKGEYLDVCGHQCGIVLIMYFLTLVGGHANYLLFQFLGAISFSFAGRLVYSYLLKKNVKIANFTFFISVVYFPIWMFTSYTYGNMLGMALGISAVIYQLLFLEENKKIYMILSAGLIALACICKSFSYIFLIAMLLIYGMKFLGDKQRMMVLGMLVTIAIAVVVSVGSSFSMKLVSHNSVRQDSGMTMFSFIMMGLDLDENKTNPGWYTAYNVASYMQNDCSNSKAMEANKQELQYLLQDIQSDPYGYSKLMAKKIHSIWNEPTFGILYRNRINSPSGLKYHSGIYNALMTDSGRLHRIAMLFLRCLQSLIYLGTLIYLFSQSIQEKVENIIGILSFIGGFIFLVFWEGKSEYAIGFFVMLIPYAVGGWGVLFDSIKERTLKSQIKVGYKVIITVVIGLFVSFIFLPRQYQDEEWNNYIKDRYYITSGDYNLVSKDGMYTLDNIYLDFAPLEQYWFYIIYDNAERYYYKFLNWDEVDTSQFDRLAVDDDLVLDMSHFNPDLYEGNYRWKIERENGGLLIRWCMDYNKVLSYENSTGKVVLADYQEGNESQIWELKNK